MLSSEPTRSPTVGLTMAFGVLTITRRGNVPTLAHVSSREAVDVPPLVGVDVTLMTFASETADSNVNFFL